MKKQIVFDDVFKKLMADPKFRKEWERSEPHYQLMSAIIGARIEKKLTQQQLAKKAKTTQAVISRIQNGTVSPTLDMVQRIAEAMDKKLEIRFT